jgi:hypothetical protein
MCRFRRGRERHKMADRSAPLQSLGIKVWSLIVAGDRIDRGLMNRGWLREIRWGSSDYQEREQSRKRKNRPSVTTAAPGISVKQHVPHLQQR